MTLNTATSLNDLISQVQTYAATLTEEGTDQRLILYMIRDSCWRAMMEIDKISVRDYFATHPNASVFGSAYQPPAAAASAPQFTAEDI